MKSFPHGRIGLISLGAAVLIGFGVLIAVLSIRAEQTTMTDETISLFPPYMTRAETVQVSNDNRDLRLENDRDYRVELPEVLTSHDGLVISGGRNVTLIGGEIAPRRDGSKDKSPESKDQDDNDQSGVVRGLYLKDQTGTVHIEGLRITGDDLEEGINLSQTKGAVVQLANIAVDTVHGSQDGAHADVIQTWAGPKTLKIDRLVGKSQYQGFFLLPFQHNRKAKPVDWSFRRVRIELNREAGYGLWKEGKFGVLLDDVTVSREGGPSSAELSKSESNKDAENQKLAWPSVEDWPGLQSGKTEPVLTGNPGTRYKSPGYR